jgi:hypothetical protein
MIIERLPTLVANAGSALAQANLTGGATRPPASTSTSTGAEPDG